MESPLQNSCVESSTSTARKRLTTCQTCSVKFLAERTTRKFCSDICRRQARSAREQVLRFQPRKCLRCSKTFVPNSGPHKFCSVRCRGRNHRSNPVEKQKQRKRQQQWRKLNRERYRTYHREYFHTYKARKLATTPWREIFFGTKQRAKVKNIEFALDQKWFAARWTGRCELTGLSFSDPASRTGHKNKHFSPSVDRIDPKGGYTKDNCRIVLWAVNCLKQDGVDEIMYDIAQALIKNRRNSVRMDSPGGLPVPHYCSSGRAC